MGDPKFFAAALKFANATDLLREFGLEETALAVTADGSPEEVLERWRALQKERRQRVMMHFY
jgi:hypothetical protein